MNRSSRRATLSLPHPQNSAENSGEPVRTMWYGSVSCVWRFCISRTLSVSNHGIRAACSQLRYNNSARAHLIRLGRCQPPRRVCTEVRIMKRHQDTMLHHAPRLRLVVPKGLAQMHRWPHHGLVIPFKCRHGKGQQRRFARAPIPL